MRCRPLPRRSPRSSGRRGRDRRSRCRGWSRSHSRRGRGSYWRCWRRRSFEMAPNDAGCVNSPTLTRASVIAGHPPTQHSVPNLWGQIHYRRDKASRVPTPCGPAGEWTAPVGGDGAVVFATLKTSPHSNVLKCSSAVHADLQNAPVEADVRILA
jgi:hypothetical protein